MQNLLLPIWLLSMFYLNMETCDTINNSANAVRHWHLKTKHYYYIYSTLSISNSHTVSITIYGSKLNYYQYNFITLILVKIYFWPKPETTMFFFKQSTYYFPSTSFLFCEKNSTKSENMHVVYNNSNKLYSAVTWEPLLCDNSMIF